MFLRQGDEQDAILARVGMENIRERRRDHTAETVVRESPGRVFPRGSAAKVLARHQNFCIFILRLIQHKIRMRRARLRSLLNAPPIEEQKVLVSRALDTFEKLLRDNLIGIDVRAIEGRYQPFMLSERLHAKDSTSRNCHLRTSVKCPETAAAAAIAGLTRWVLPPRPCRPSKLRLLVGAQRSPGARMSGFMPRHMEQPGSRQSKPAARKTSSSPSASACFFTCCEPGTTIARPCG